METLIKALVIFQISALCFMCFGFGFSFGKNSLPKWLKYSIIAVFILNIVLITINIFKL
ncbi:MAG: hypothetical protein ACRCX2_33650 [Paraclostridium sp.]